MVDEGPAGVVAWDAGLAAEGDCEIYKIHDMVLSSGEEN